MTIIEVEVDVEVVAAKAKVEACGGWVVSRARRRRLAFVRGSSWLRLRSAQLCFCESRLDRNVEMSAKWRM